MCCEYVVHVQLKFLSVVVVISAMMHVRTSFDVCWNLPAYT